jgi:hypothetical protein
MIFQSRMMPAPSGMNSFRPPARTLQRKCACGGTPGPSGECAECKRKRLSLQPKLTVNQPGDRYEQEADRVAEAVVGGSGSTWPVISSLGKGTVQREDPPKPKTEAEKYKEAAKKAGEAFLETPPGQEIKKKAEEIGDAFISTLPGKIITGTAVAGAVVTLAATHKELPIGIPEIPLDKIKPGLKMKITYEGPVDKPSKVAVGFSIPLGRKSPEKKGGPTESEKRRAETARIAADQARVREGLKTDEEKAADQKFVNDYVASKMLRPDQFTPRTSPLSFGTAGEQLGFHPGAPAPGPRSSLGPLVPDFKLTDEKPAPEPKKEEEKTLQRKSAEQSATTAPPIVDQVLQSSGQPLDASTCALMERRFGYDFANVRIYRDAQAAESARAVNANAYTVGSQIVFDSSRYAPETEEGRRLLAHELTHVVQQGQVTPADRNFRSSDSPVPGVTPSLKTSVTIARQPKSKDDPDPPLGGGKTSPPVQLPVCNAQGVDQFIPDPQAPKAHLWGLTQLSGAGGEQPDFKVAAAPSGKGVVVQPTKASIPPIPMQFMKPGRYLDQLSSISGQEGGALPPGSYQVVWSVTKEGSERIRAGEQEHCNDFQLAFYFSLYRFAEIVNQMATQGTEFPNEAAARAALARQVAIEPAKLPGYFKCLGDKMAEKRDSSHWHTPPPAKAERATVEYDSTLRKNVAVVEINQKALPEVGKHPSITLLFDDAAPACIGFTNLKPAKP